MNYTYPFPLTTYDSLRSYTRDYMEKYNKNDIYAVGVKVSKEIKNNLEEELISYGLPGISNFLAFKRKNYITPRLYTVHIDVDYSDNFIHASIVLPIDGCAGTTMFWMEGQYKRTTHLLPDGDSYQLLDWKNKPKIIAEREIIEPTLCCVDVPHDALSNADGSYRTVLTIRLKGNPTFDEIIKKRYNQI